ncbi:MAG: DUF302 domain-containing protein [Enterobacterales bacterium]|nr:DUF302 domain-containing protein [Enterobacterales bacterium]
MLRFLYYALLLGTVQTNIYAAQESKSPNSQASPVQANGLVTYKSHYSHSETLARLTKLLKSKKFILFNQVDHSLAAKKQNIDLMPTSLVIFGKPSVGSRLMQCQPSIAIDLPQKALVWEDKEGQVWLSINQMSYLKNRHNLSQCTDLVEKVSNALDGLMRKVAD